MKQMMERILAAYGSPAEVIQENGSTSPVRAFVQPVTERYWKELRQVKMLGEVQLGSWLYIGPAEELLADGQEVRCRDEAFVTMRAEVLCIGEEALYTWALLRKKGGDAPWRN